MLSTRLRGFGTSDPTLWVTTREIPEANWTAMTASDFMTGTFNISDIDEIAVPVGSAYGCLELHVPFVGTPRVVGEELLMY